MNLRIRRPLTAMLLSIFTAGIFLPAGLAAHTTGTVEGRRWLAGDHHIHSRFSVGWNRETAPPTPIIAGDAIYPTPMNAVMSRYFGLSWMVTTDHGGPRHSKVNLERAYPELLLSRRAVPEVVQFYGMEFDTPGADHSSLIIPHTHDEAQRLESVESRFAKREPFPADPTWDTEPRMLEALTFMNRFEDKPVVIANHPSRSATGPGVYGLDTPAELRDWNDTAPEIAVGMAGAPGHQAATLNPDGTRRDRARGSYRHHPTMGGFDQMTARLGGFWDAMLGEGRRWWITANSDSHINWREGGADFWPGEYSKTYVWATRSHDDILDGIRHGRVFVTLGDLISELEVRAQVVDGTAGAGGRAAGNGPQDPPPDRSGATGTATGAGIGATLQVPAGAGVEVTIRFLDPDTLNAGGDNPSVTRVDLITGDVTGPVTDRSTDTNPSTRVVARFTASDWQREGPYRTMTHRLPQVGASMYLRVRGTNGDELEPDLDPKGEDPWADLWFYGNPVFLDVR